MSEQARIPFSKLMEDSSGKIPEQLIHDLPDEFVEFLLIDQRRRVQMERSPGKYDELLDGLQIVSNFNPLAKLHLAPSVGSGYKPAVEPAYFWGRWHNDIADDKTSLPPLFKNYPELVAHHKGLLAPLFDTGFIPKGLTIDFLLKRAVTKLEKVEKREDDTRQDLSIFLDSMLIEYNRRINKTVSTFDELTQIYDLSFGRPHNIMLIALESSSRAEQISLLPQIQGGMYNSEKDSLFEDLKLGICYIPAEVLSTSGLTLEELIINPELVETNKKIVEWRQGEFYRCSKMYAILLADIRGLDWKAKYYVKSLTKNMENIFKNPPEI